MSSSSPRGQSFLKSHRELDEIHSPVKQRYSSDLHSLSDVQFRLLFDKTNPGGQPQTFFYHKMKIVKTILIINGLKEMLYLSFLRQKAYMTTITVILLTWVLDIFGNSICYG